MIKKPVLRSLVCSLFLLISAFQAQANPSTRYLQIPFYTETISIAYTDDIIITSPRKMEEKIIVDFYKKLEQSSYQSVSTALQKSKQRFQLNDWLTYDLVTQTVNRIYSNKGKTYKVLATWFFMSKLNYDTRLTFLARDAFLYIRTNDNIYETPVIEDGGNRFAGLTELQYKRTKRNKAIYLLNFLAAPNGNAFSLGLNGLPTFKPNLQKKEFRFTWRDKKFSVDVQLDKNLIDMMKRYPIIDESGYITAPFSKYLENSLLAQLEKIIANRSLVHQLEIITAFTRSAFDYKTDENHFGRSKPMIREEVFYYPYSDCEDRVAVFFGLVKELLNLPMLVIAFPDHLTIAVALDQPIGPAIRHKGKKYYICDPTKGYEKKSFEILYNYN